MGMTIDEAKKMLERYNHGFCESSGGLSEPIKVAINIMRKYQKIKEIVKNTDRNADTVRNALAFGDIAKVVEDGKID